jgi:hypothetical protein
MCFDTQDYERRFQVVVNDYSKLQQEHKQQASEVEVLSKVSSNTDWHCMESSLT